MNLNNFLLYFLGMFAASLLAGILVLKVFPRLKLMDRPKRYGLTRKPVPYPAGVILFPLFALGVYLFAPEIYDSTKGLLLGGAVITTISFLDDRFSLNPLLRFFVQICCALILIYFSVGIEYINTPLGGYDLTSWKIDFLGGHITVWSDLMTIFLVLLFTNAMNWFDGSPALPSGISLIASLMLFSLALRPDLHAIDQTQFATYSIILAGILAGFLVFDFPPIRWVMGDSGSMFLGFTLATLAIISGGKLATTFLILGVPIMDAIIVILRRLWQGKAPWKGDYEHIHHRLLRAGFSPRQTALTVYAMALIFGIVALQLSTFGKGIAMLILGGVILLGEWALMKKGKH